MAAFALVGLILATAAACGSDPDAQPPVASVDFQPRVVVTVTDGGVDVGTGPRQGATTAAGEPAATTPAGSVVELTNAADRARRVVITTTPADDPGADPAPWADTGDLEPGETVVLGLSAAGEYRFGVDGTDQGTTIRVEPRPAA